MTPAKNFAEVATVRRREIATRVSIGGFIAVAAWVLSPSFWPMVWFGAMVVTQLFDRAVGRKVETAGAEANRALIAAYIFAVALNTTTFASITAYLWLVGGDAGSWFALLLCAGGMLHVSLRSYRSHWMLAAGAGPHVAFLFVMPVAMMIRQGHSVGTQVVVVIGGLLYVLQLVTGVRQSRAFLGSLNAAADDANTARELAEQANAAKSEFLATVSHEIRTPMNAVLSAAYLLKRTALTTEQAAHVAMLTDGGEVLVGLLNDVLDISKIEAGKMVLDSADLDLPSALDSLIKLYREKAAAKGVALILDGAANLPVAIRTDPLRLRQILFNLLSNAVKFTDHGQITLAVGRALGPEGEILWCEVRDTGPGIDADAMSRLFGSFEQAKAETARNHGGTGLGLAISRRLAEMMGGGLTCTSVVGQGSIFRLEQPLAIAAPIDRTEAKRPVPAVDEVGLLSILVAEDHEVNRKIVGLFLEPLGWRLTMAKDGAEAVAHAGEQTFDAILMDMQMPVLGGVEAALAIRTGGGPNAATPIIALTANALGHHRAAWEPVGAAAFLTKPINPELLIESLLVAAAARTENAAEACAA